MFLALDKEVDAVTDNIETIDFVFLIIYSTEMVMKIIAMGFVMRMNSYLRDTWNCVSNFDIISIISDIYFCEYSLILQSLCLDGSLCSYQQIYQLSKYLGCCVHLEHLIRSQI